MFGYLRFILASMVAISHMGLKIGNLNPGVIAVVIFYMLAGYVVTHLLENVFVSGENYHIKNFYLERILRIFPLYLAVCFLTILFLLITKYAFVDFGLLKVIGNLTVIPLSYYKFFDFWILLQPKNLLIPPAWSLGVELQAYIFLPFVIRYRKIKYFLGIFSFIIFLFSNIGYLHSNLYGYRLLPGVFFFFIVGSTIYKYKKYPDKSDLFDKYFGPICYIILIIILIGVGLENNLGRNYVREVFLGFICGVPMIYYLSSSSIKLPLNKLFGSISYGIFLTHCLAKMFINNYFSHLNIGLYNKSLLVISLSIFISYIFVFLIEKPIFDIRLGISGKNK